MRFPSPSSALPPSHPRGMMTSPRSFLCSWGDELSCTLGNSEVYKAGSPFNSICEIFWIKWFIHFIQVQGVLTESLGPPRGVPLFPSSTGVSQPNFVVLRIAMRDGFYLPSIEISFFPWTHSQSNLWLKILANPPSKEVCRNKFMLYLYSYVDSAQ